MAKKKAKSKARKKSPKTAASSLKEYKPVAHHFKELVPQRKTHMVIGVWALILAVIASITLALTDFPALAVILVIVGFIVGFLNFEHEESVKFIVATLGLLVVATAVLMTGFSRLEVAAPVIALYLRRASYNVIAVVAPAAFVVSMKALKELAE